MDIKETLISFAKDTEQYDGGLESMVRMTVLACVNKLVVSGITNTTKPIWELYNEFRNCAKGKVDPYHISRDAQTYMRHVFPSKIGYIDSQSLDSLEAALRKTLPSCINLIDTYWDHYEVESDKEIQQQKLARDASKGDLKEYKQPEELSETDVETA